MRIEHSSVYVLNLDAVDRIDHRANIGLSLQKLFIHRVAVPTVHTGCLSWQHEEITRDGGESCQERGCLKSTSMRIVVFHSQSRELSCSCFDEI